MNKKYTLCTIVLLCTVLLFSALADQNDQMDKPTEKPPYEIVGELVSIWPWNFTSFYTPLPEELLPFDDVIQKIRSLGKNQYAGIYSLDGWAKLHVNLLDTLPQDAMVIENPDIEVHYVKHSIKQLEEARELLQTHRTVLRDKYGYWFAQVDVINSRLVIAVTEDVKGIEVYISELGIKPDMYAIYIHDGSVIFL